MTKHRLWKRPEPAQALAAALTAHLFACAATYEDAATREVREETGVVVRAVARRAPIDWTYPERRVRLHPIDCAWVNGDGELREVAELRWVSTDELRTLTFPDANASLVAELVASRPST